MNIEIEELKNSDLALDKYKIIIEYNKNSKDSERFIQYIKNYSILNRELFLDNNGLFENVKLKDILYFYSKGRYNYAKTKEKEYKIKSRLYELEDDNFLRISKHCIVNIEHIDNFDLTRTGCFIVNIDNGEQEVVSRRCIKNILYFLDEKGV